MKIWSLWVGIALFAWAQDSFAAIRFLPDVEQQDVGVQVGNANVNVDEALCREAVDRLGRKLYHKANGCPQGMIFDEYCPHSNEWISECYKPQNPNNLTTGK